MTAVIIIGGTRGLGKALAAEFVRAGCHVVLTGRHCAEAASVATTLGPRALGLGCEVTDPASVAQVWDQAAARFGVIDHWVQNAGTGAPSVHLADLPPDQIAHCINVNLTGAFIGAQVALRGLANTGAGWIWLTEGLGSTGPVIAGSGPYSASKAGATSAFAVLDQECRGTGVKVGYLRPTLMPTDLLPLPDDPGESQMLDRMIRFVGESPEDAARWFAPRMLRARRGGTRLSRVALWRLAARALRRNLPV